MKKFVFAALGCAFLGLNHVSAQQTQCETALDYPYKVITNRFTDNWFVGLGAGVNIYAGDHDQHISVGDRLAPAINAYIGKWFTPGLGLRAAYSGLYWKGASLTQSTPFARASFADGYYKQKGNFVNIHADVMLNLSEMLYGHNPNRTYSFIPYVGAGVIHSTSAPHNDELSANAGIINRFRVNGRFGVNLELAGTWFKDRFDGEIGKKKVDGLGQVTIGISYRIGKNGFDRNIIRFTGVSKQELDNAMETANNLRTENAKLSKENSKLKDAYKNAQKRTTESVVTKRSMPPVYVLFELGKAKLSKEQRINLKYAAETIKAWPEHVFVMEGYADNSTGSVETNRKLSAERTTAVKKCLVEEFGVSEKQLLIIVKGGVDNMFYNDPALSRAVIIKQ